MKAHWFPVVLFSVVLAVICVTMFKSCQVSRADDKAFDTWLSKERRKGSRDTPWIGPDEDQIPDDTDSGQLIRYGEQLIARTADYLGPKGTVAHLSNGMNCQNCHLHAGTMPYANNFGKVYSTYPQFGARNNAIQTIYGRIDDCFERSLNGRAPDSNSREMRAIYAYMKWLGKGIPRGDKPKGTGNPKLAYMDRAADPSAGRKVYQAKCQTCHGDNGQGLLGAGGADYAYPPLWGPHSYNDGAGMYRISFLAGFVKDNMPFGTTYHHPKLSDEEAWDVAAFVNSQPRPHKDQSKDWKDLAKKPFDFPFGPYLDSRSEQQHKYGPYTTVISQLKQ